jgi:hypothetical protein
MRSTRLRLDQNGIALSPDWFVDVGMPALSLMPQTILNFATSR